MYTYGTQSHLGWNEEGSSGRNHNTSHIEAAFFPSLMAQCCWWVYLGFALFWLSYSYSLQSQSRCVHWCAEFTVTKQGIKHQLSLSGIHTCTSSTLRQQSAAVWHQGLSLMSSGIELCHGWCWLWACVCWARSSAEHGNLWHECISEPLACLFFQG